MVSENIVSVAIMQNSQLIPKYYQLSKHDFIEKNALCFLMSILGNINKKLFLI